jgi:murein L,D-transpeptidase YcbB/YkuD
MELGRNRASSGPFWRRWLRAPDVNSGIERLSAVCGRPDHPGVMAYAGALLVLAGGADCARPPDPRHDSADLAVVDRAPAQVSWADVAEVIRARIRAPSGVLFGSLTRTERTDLATLYEAEAHAPVWVDAAGRPAPSAREALSLLEGAAKEGLDPTDYGSGALAAMAAALDESERPSPGDIARFDLAMSAGVLRCFRHLHQGRVDPRTIGLRLSVPADRHDLVGVLRSAVADGRILEAAADLAPPSQLYRLLRPTLARYRALAVDPTLVRLPPLIRTVRTGDWYEGLAALHRQLVALGDLPPAVPAPGEDTLYDEFFTDAVRRFQVRHGLQTDGVLGKATHAALTVPLTWRVRQIELALERLRWLPDLSDRRLVVLNIPMFHLWGWDSGLQAGEPSFSMRAIVGRALSTQTPVFVEEMRHLIFRPYWNVPASILRHEILPILGRDLDYLRREDLEIVRGPGDDARPVAPTAENRALLEQGVLRLRQRPGPGNALGLVKFVFPNNEHVYLHATPARELFDRARRDFSHGCVRVEDPVSLAAWALEDQRQWTRERIVEAMAGTETEQVNLKHPIQVVLFYTTAMVLPDDGTMRFAEDIYRHDDRLDRALRRGMVFR